MDCLFCKMVTGEIPCKKIYEDEEVIAILDLHPDADGHTLLIPKKHIEDITKLDSETLLHMHEVTLKLMPLLMEKTHSTGFSTRFNYGESQYVKHVHLHLLPNYHITKPTLTQEEAYELLKDIQK